MKHTAPRDFAESDCDLVFSGAIVTVADENVLDSSEVLIFQVVKPTILDFSCSNEKVAA